MTDPKKKEKRPGVEAPYVPEFEVPDPPVPNRAWTAMRQGMDIEELTEEEKRDMYYGRDSFL